MYSDETGHTTNREKMRLPQQVVPTRDRAHHIPWRTAALIAGAVAIVALAVWGIGRFTDGDEDLPPVPNVPEATSTVPAGEGTESPGVVATQTPPSTTESTTPEGDSAVAGEPFKLRIVIADDGASWLRVTVDGLKAYEGTLAGGQSKEWDVQEEAVMRVGKPSSVTVYRNDEELQIPAATETPEMNITATDPAAGSAEQ